jgi:parvulin-like peptidyl-prolyl isomerase
LLRRLEPTVDSARIAAIEKDSTRLFTQEFVKGTDEVVIRINDGRVRSDAELRTTISHMAMQAGDQPFDTLLRRAVDFSQEELALTAAASQKGYTSDPAVAAAGKKSLDSALVETYLKETIASRITFNRQEFEDYYNAHPDSFRNADQYALDQMTVGDSSTAQQVMQRLADGADFAYLARQFAGEYKAANLSEKNAWFPLFALPPAIAADVAQAKIGSATRAFPVAEGWIIFRLAGRRQGDLKPLAEVEMNIREVIFQRKFDSALDAALNLLKANSEITYNESAIKKYFGN